MALTFNNANTDDVTFRADTRMDNHNAFTVCMWVYPTGDSNSRRWWTKGTWKEMFNGFFGSNDFGVAIGYTTSDAEAVCGADTLVPNTWNFVAATFDATDGVKLFRGSQTVVVSECSYAFQVGGSGTIRDDSAGPWTIGNTSASGTLAYEGQMWLFAHFQRKFNLGDIRRFQSQPRPDYSCDVFTVLDRVGTVVNTGPRGLGCNGTVNGPTANSFRPRMLPMETDLRRYRSATGGGPATGQPTALRYSVLRTGARRLGRGF